MSGRVGTSLLSALGLPELSFHSVKELEDAAVALAQSPGRLATLRKRQEDWRYATVSPRKNITNNGSYSTVTWMSWTKVSSGIHSAYSLSLKYRTQRRLSGVSVATTPWPRKMNYTQRLGRNRFFLRLAPSSNRSLWVLIRLLRLACSRCIP